jgi:hypothetical protein
MECSEYLLSGKAQALDIPIDTIKEFVEIFNSHVPGDLTSPSPPDINELERTNMKIHLTWSSGSKKSKFEFNLDEKTFTLVSN